MGGGVAIGAKNDLRDAVAVSQVDKDRSTVVAARGNPAEEGGALPDVILAELVTAVCASSL